MKQFIIITFILNVPLFLLAQKNDTLNAVKILSIKDKKSITNTTPLQELTALQIEKTNSLNVADAVKSFAGVQIKDYGGVGGLKTVSVRSLGANHTGILYDGIALGDAQGGQIDLGKFSIDNIEHIQLLNGSPSEQLLPAKAFATASLIILKSTSAATTKNNFVKVKLQQGSFGLISPSILLRKTFSEKIKMALSAWYQNATNQYPFISYENNTDIVKRTNSDIKASRVEYDFNYNYSEANKIQLKLYYYNSKRGLPGSIILYNNTSNQRLHDENFFAQATWLSKPFKRQELLLSTKFSADKNFYLDPTYPNAAGKLENDFRQKEYYFSAVYKFVLNDKLSFNYASDLYKNNLIRTDSFFINFANPSRNNLLNNIAVTYKHRAFTLNGNILHTNISEMVKNGKAGKNFSKFTPAISFSIKPIQQKNIYLRAFYKTIYRVPTFNDLYYTNIGNVLLKPEYAKQINAGITFSKNDFFNIAQFSFTADAYLNKVKDKILAVPRQNLFQWSMQNIGEVSIKGIDATSQITFKKWQNILFNASFSYTYQQAVDLSDNNADEYNTQLPYTPMHSGSVQLGASYKSITLNYNFLGSSLRFKQGAQIAENGLNPWASHDVSAAVRFKEKYKILAEANNILNTQYEIIKYYPMPRFNYRITLTINLNQTKK